jgi:hypothetical protein
MKPAGRISIGWKMSRSQLFCGDATSLKAMPTSAAGRKRSDDVGSAETDGPSNFVGHAEIAPRHARVIDAPPLSRPVVTLTSSPFQSVSRPNFFEMLHISGIAKLKKKIGPA